MKKGEVEVKEKVMESKDGGNKSSLYCLLNNKRSSVK